MKYFWFALLFFALAYLAPIAGRPLHCPDEFRYAELPREMIETGDFVTPRLLRARYFEKPVLGYWLVAGSFKLFGENRFAARLPMALAAGLTALLLALWIRRTTRDREWALWAALFYLTTALGWLLGTTAVLDSILCLFTTATLICVHQAVTAEKRNFERVVWLALCGVTAGLGFMTKGFVAWAVPGCATVAWLVWTKRWKTFLWLPWIPLVSLAATIAPWSLEIHRAEPDFWHYFVVVEHFQRFNANTKTQHPEPFWFYVPILLGTLFPALFTVLPGAAAGREFWKKVWKNDLWRFSFCAFLLPFCFFSASKGKLAPYILVCYPFVAALLVHPALEALRSSRRGAQLTAKWVFDVLGWVFFVLGAAGIAFALALLPPVSLQRVIPALNDAAAFFALFGAAFAAGGFQLIRSRGAFARRIAVFFGSFALAAATTAALPDFGSDRMPERDLRALAASGEFDPRTAQILTYGGLAHATAWTFRRSDTRLLFSAGEMEYGVEWARRDGRPLLLTHDDSRKKEGVGNEMKQLLCDPKRDKTVVYFALSSELERSRGKLLLSLKPRVVERGNLIALVFDPPVTSAAPPQPPSKPSEPSARATDPVPPKK